MVKKLKINDEFQSKFECFERFKDLINKEMLNLIDYNTDDVPLYKANELIKKDYVWIKIINENQDKRTGKYSFEDNYEYCICDISCYAGTEILLPDRGYLFLFIEENKKYRFLGLYKRIEVDADASIIKWQKQKISDFYLRGIDIKELIEKLDCNDIELHKLPKIVIEKFDYNRIKKYINDKEKLKEIIEENAEIYKFLPEKLKSDEELAATAIRLGPHRRCI